MSFNCKLQVLHVCGVYSFIFSSSPLGSVELFKNEEFFLSGVCAIVLKIVAPTDWTHREWMDFIENRYKLISAWKLQLWLHSYESAVCVEKKITSNEQTESFNRKVITKIRIVQIELTVKKGTHAYTQFENDRHCLNQFKCYIFIIASIGASRVYCFKCIWCFIWTKSKFYWRILHEKKERLCFLLYRCYCCRCRSHAFIQSHSKN